MNKSIFAIVSIILSYIFVFFTPYALTAIIAAIPLFVFKPKFSSLYGFLIGFIVPLSIYIIYPFNYIVKLSNIIGSLVGFPSIIVIIIFPLLYGIIMAISSAIYSGIYEKRKS
ncbi:MAG: hypothetical protein ACP5F1_02910 [Thermoplasmata archaeon]|nr:hypothetical protein [Thermoplasmata archaeon]